MQRGCRSVEDCHAERRVSYSHTHREATGLLQRCRRVFLLTLCREAVDLLRIAMQRGVSLVTLHTERLRVCYRDAGDFFF